MINKALVLGYFGYANNQLDGQTVKTRNIYDLLKSKEKEVFDQVTYFDTQTFQKSKFEVFNSFRQVTQTNVLFYLPAQNNLRFIFPFVFILCKIFNVEMHYVVVGGWLGDFLKKKPMHRWMLSKVQGIYPQTSQLTSVLKQEYRLNNVVQLNNFRITDFQAKPKSKKEALKLVFMARIHPLKGVKTIFELEKELLKQKFDSVTIDMYGPLYSPFEEEFNQLCAQSQLIKYKGILEPSDIYKTLETYDLMLFPTEFYTEGFPGTILDAYIAEIPVVASDWKYAFEFVKNNESGIIAEFKNSQDFIAKTIQLLNNKEQLSALKQGTNEQKQKYSPENAWQILKARIKA